MAMNARGSVSTFAEAVARAPEPPCDHYECAERDQCASEHMACAEFLVYVTSGRSINPRLRGRQFQQIRTWELAADPAPDHDTYRRMQEA